MIRGSEEASRFTAHGAVANPGFVPTKAPGPNTNGAKNTTILLLSQADDIGKALFPSVGTPAQQGTAPSHRSLTSAASREGDSNRLGTRLSQWLTARIRGLFAYSAAHPSGWCTDEGGVSERPSSVARESDHFPLAIVPAED